MKYREMEQAIAGRGAEFSTKELKHQAESLRPFLFDEQEAGLIAHAHKIIPHLIMGKREIFRDKT